MGSRWVGVRMCVVRVLMNGGEEHFNVVFFFFQAEDGIRDAQESRGLGDVYKRQILSTGKNHQPYMDRN